MQIVTPKGIPTGPRQAGRNFTDQKWHDIIKEMKGRNLQPRAAYPERLSFRFEGEMKSCADKQVVSSKCH